MKICKKCNIVKSYVDYHKDKLQPDGFALRCKLCRKGDSKKEYDLNKEKKKKQTNEYYYANKDKIRIVKRNYQLRKEKEDILFKLARRLRNRLYYALKRTTWEKNVKFNDYIGCTLEELKLHIQSKFTEGMTWDNYGEWHIDHIMPLSLAKTEQELYKLQHFLNLQPLWRCDNIKKSNKVE